MKKVLIIDNYDSFTYNLVHILRELGVAEDMRIVRNDQFELSEVENYSHVLLSPGPGLPKDAGLMPNVIAKYASTKNILGVCLGHQGIGEAFGATLLNLPKVYHGMVTPIELRANDQLFEGLPASFNVCRYHSWVVDKESLPDELEVTSVAENGNIMSFKHKEYNVRGVQFHPESIMTEHGKQLMKNWVEL
ncbi:anthranilate synthase, component II [Ekhidna lutea]|uniref:Anthranilate synthase, component II n=1 Tax=Ekhidna lutea TaxID=447679 RepID=A0A239M3L9_EKHLU|nr:aminodeoxychorismate/anthranilate synthase component II [Ekhidna lutea]SNT36519.1 anthranilate synthase, component II [Ekhidna lutea]